MSDNRMNTSVFNRWELKYVISIKEMYQILEDLRPYTTIDYNGENGLYKISSLYYDTYDFKFYYEKKNGEKYRQKVRLRGYGDISQESKLFFEIKQRYNSTVQKKRAHLNADDVNSFILGEYDFGGSNSTKKNKEKLKEIDYLISLYTLEPKLIVSYDRKALMGIYEDNLRITFDTNLKCSNSNLELGQNSDKKYFMHPNNVVLEIKANDKIPVWLLSIIQRRELVGHRVSKYCLSEKKIYNI